MAKYIIEFNDEANKDLSENDYYCRAIKAVMDYEWGKDVIGGDH